MNQPERHIGPPTMRRWIGTSHRVGQRTQWNSLGGVAPSCSLAEVPIIIMSASSSMLFLA